VDFEDGGVAGGLVEAEEFGDCLGGNVGGTDNGRNMGGARAFTGFFHKSLDSFFIELDFALATKESGEVEREAEGVVKLEGVGGREGVSLS